MFMPRLVAVALALCCAACASQEPPPPSATGTSDMTAQAAERGRLLADRTCAGCHATGPAGVSPMAEATPFREVVRQYPLDELEAAFAQGLVTSHPAMPAFAFRASEIDDLIAWLETVKSEP